MINIDKYLNVNLEMQINGEVIYIKQPSAKITREISEIEKDMTTDNYLEIKSKICLILLNNNSNNKIFTIEDLDNIPYKVQDIIINKIIKMVVDADNDPN